MGDIIRCPRLHREMNYFKMKKHHMNWQPHLIQHAVVYPSPEAHKVVSQAKREIQTLLHEFINHN